ncbi:protein of unknown function [Methylocaldum szegediense]|uniref:Uncharacterized protein n=1 Tax=Methylocaldum szegediense TaxID=73780 RepID=A0ABM9I9M3_9GAMM|nr:protein of unknown function [Methylocaldum szegediense]
MPPTMARQGRQVLSEGEPEDGATDPVAGETVHKQALSEEDIRLQEHGYNKAHNEAKFGPGGRKDNPAPPARRQVDRNHMTGSFLEPR